MNATCNDQIQGERESTRSVISRPRDFARCGLASAAHRATTAVLVALALLLALAGCEIAGTAGEAGNLTFHDTTRAPGEFIQTNQEIDRSVAEGALLAMEVRQGGVRVTPSAAETSDDAVLSVVRVDGEAVLLRAKAAGQARVTVRAGDTEDSVVLRVSEIGQTTVHLYPAGELAADQTSLDVAEAVLLPGARIWGFVEQRGPSGEALTGYGATPCAVDAAGAAVRMGASDDGFTLDAPADKGDVETVVLSCGPTQVTMPLRTAEVATRLEAYDFFQETFGPSFDVEAGQSHYVIVLARDAEGRLVQGAAGEDVTVAVPDPSKPYVEVVDHTGQTELDQLIRQSRAVELRVSAGKDAHTLTLGWHGLTLDVTFTVVVRAVQTN